MILVMSISTSYLLTALLKQPTTKRITGYPKKLNNLGIQTVPGEYFQGFFLIYFLDLFS